jgi:protein-S-isoprenylcysteine O-methyltransferase Ste14
MYLNRFQIGPEERVLAAKFGAAFEHYRAGVRRWI